MLEAVAMSTPSLRRVNQDSPSGFVWQHAWHAAHLVQLRVNWTSLNQSLIFLRQSLGCIQFSNGQNACLDLIPATSWLFAQWLQNA